MTALVSIFCIVLAIALGYLCKVNIGMVGIAFAFLVGHLLADIPPAGIISGWPLNLFFMLLGMTLLFGIARVNGALPLAARKLVGLVGGRTRLIPPVFLVMSAALAAVGAGNISVAALVMPIGMAVASQYSIPPLLMACMVIAGANAGGLSPIAPTGIIAATLANEQNLDLGSRVFFRQILGQAILAALLYFAMRGHRLPDHPRTPGPTAGGESFNLRQKATIAVFALVVAAIVLGGWNIGFAAFLGAVLLFLVRAADEKSSLEAVPWSTLILVSGVGMLVRVAEAAGGIVMMSDILTTMMNEHTAAPILAVIGGVLSIVSSASGVVMPTLIPTVPGLVANIGGDPVHLISAIIMGAHVVTNSPISTLGALAVSAAGEDVDKGALFKNLFLLALGGLGYAALIVYIGIV